MVVYLLYQYVNYLLHDQTFNNLITHKNYTEYSSFRTESI